MKKAEDRILEKVYQYETRKTTVEILLEIFGLIFLVFAVMIFGQVIMDILREQNTLDIFQLFGENLEVIRKYFFDTVDLFYTEIPKLLVIIFLILLSGLLTLIAVMFRNFSKIKNKISSLFNFWQQQIKI